MLANVQAATRMDADRLADLMYYLSNSVARSLKEDLTVQELGNMWLQGKLKVGWGGSGRGGGG